MERHHDNPAVGNPTANSDTDDNQSVGDVVPEMNPQVSTYRLPRFSSRRLSSSSSMGDYDRLPRTKSMFPEPQQLTKDDLTSADALMADGVFTMNSTLSTVIENALGHPIPGLEDAYVVGGDVPYQSEEFAARFQQSSIFHSTLKQLDAPVEDSMVFADFTPFRQTFNEDLSTLLKREVTLTMRDTTWTTLTASSS
ncbi:hypothetical protein PC121_g17009 [Phytophthora cactorum]|nr:hypothetical protein PC121_g17009 [Phytophthora cactorum]